MDILDELEIKVEYYEDNKIDPLTLTGETNNENDGNRDSCKHNVEITENRFLKDYYEKEVIKTENWYKSIDKSGRFLCRFCNLSYSTIQTLRYHTKRKHLQEAQKLKDTVANKRRDSKIKCHVCKEPFPCLNDLKEHTKVKHELDNVNFCHICQAVFIDNSLLSDHMISKHNILFSKLHSCGICGYRTLKLSHFKQHRNTHIKNKAFKCPQCNYTTSYSPNLTIHLHVHDQNKKYSCNFEGCNFKTTTSSALRSHNLKHNPEHNFLYCDKCPYKTVYRPSLKKHILSHIRSTLKAK